MPAPRISVFSVKNSQYASGGAASAAKNAWTYNWASHFKADASSSKKPANETTQRQRLQQTTSDDDDDAGEDDDDVADAFGFITGYMHGNGARPKMIDAFLNNKYGGRWPLACMYPWMEFAVEQKAHDSVQWRVVEPMQLPTLRAAYMDTTTYGALRFVLQNVLGRGDLMRTLGFDAYSYDEPLALTREWLEAPQHVELRKAVDECPPVFYLFYKPLYERLVQFYAHTVVPTLLTLPGAVIRTAHRWLDSPADCYRLAFSAFTHYKLPEMSISALKKRALLSDEQMLAVHVYQEVLKVDALATWRSQRPPEEVASGLRYYSEQNGHDYTPLNTLRELVSPTRWRPPGSGRTATGGLWTPALLDRALALLETERIVVIDQERFVYLRPIYVWTTHCIRGMVDFCHSRAPIRNWYPEDAAPDAQCNYAQRAAFEKARSTPIVLITGRGGTGKTFVIRSILAHLPREAVLCAAPTGRAASVISEMSGYVAHTMHSILRSKSIDFVKIHALVIDEMSMSGLELMSHFLTRIFERCVSLERVFLVGDHRQLPPIEGGCLMENLVTRLRPNPYIALVRLTENKRSSSAIMYHNQDAILAGRPELMHWDDTTFSFVEVPDTHEAQRRALDEFFETNAADQENWHIITAKNDTANRVNNIYYDAHVRRNSALKRSIREENVRFRKFRAFQLVYPIGIKMAYTCNFNKIGVTNGTVFVVEGYEDSVKDDDKRTLRPNHMLDRLPTKRSNKRAVRLRQACTENKRIECDVKKYDLRAKAKVAAASTVHKFQGSQRKFIYYLIHPGDSWVLTDRHLVTAIGRAENRVVIAAKKEEFEKAARTPWIERRSRFAEMLSETLTLGEARVSVSSVVQ